MMRTAVLSAVVLAGSVAAEAWITRAERSRRAGDPAVERLVPDSRVEGATVAAISVETDREPLFYYRKGGRWRCLQAFGAVCDEDAVRALRLAFLGARGVERASGPADDERYGFVPGERLAVGFHGPKALESEGGDVLFAFEVGRSFDEGPRGRAFVREHGSTRVLEVDVDPRRALRGGTQEVPPLVDARLLAGCFDGEFRGFVEIRVAHADGERYRVAHDPDAPADTDTGWILERGGARERLPGWRAGGFAGLLLRGRFDGFESPARLDALGLDPPAATVVLVLGTGEEVEIDVSAVDPARRARVRNRTTGVVGTVPGDLQPLLAPRPELFTDESRPNPWEAWLRKP